ncbi:MAG: ribonuclease III [Pelagibacterales bacterium]|nr:ribonuclease III [Pelagibacterales bacterium]
MIKMRDITKIESTLNYKFNNQKLLLDALTHTSYLNNKEEISFERLEFLGDRVLGLAISDILYEIFPKESEGDLARRIAVLVSGKTLAEIANNINIPDVILVADNLSFKNGENHSILADAMEAIIGAIFLDSNYNEALIFIKYIWSKLILNYNSPPQDPKSKLQEFAMANKYSMPLYSNYSKDGPDHAPKYKVLVKITNIGECYGQGVSKKEAERMAAITLLKIIESA